MLNYLEKDSIAEINREGISKYSSSRMIFESAELAEELLNLSVSLA